LQLTHVRLIVDDLDACVAFYRDVVGLTLSLEVGGTYYEFEAGPVKLALYRSDLMSDVVKLDMSGPGRPRVVLNIEVDDVDATAASLVDRGAPRRREPHDQPRWGLRVAHFDDPDGNIVEFFSVLPNAVSGSP
jgi:lactoylglutathione lyase